MVTPTAVLFDLDGTLADTAPDLGGALNRLRVEEGLPVLPLQQLRPHASAGARGLIGEGFGMTKDDLRYTDLQARFLALYEQHICDETRLFPGMEDVLDQLEQRCIKWGVVTNKHARFTTPLMDALGLARRAACVISGDTAARSKPDPAPLLMACSQAGIDPGNAIYVGDDERDVQAGRAARMRTVIAAWGYCFGAPIETWGGDVIIHQPAEVIRLLDRAW